MQRTRSAWAVHTQCTCGAHAVPAPRRSSRSSGTRRCRGARCRCLARRPRAPPRRPPHSARGSSRACFGGEGCEGRAVCGGGALREACFV
eukprot:scaffold65979_cov80-Phaeocystis_antarctica.AAC.1